MGHSIRLPGEAGEVEAFSLEGEAVAAGFGEGVAARRLERLFGSLCFRIWRSDTGIRFLTARSMLTAGSSI